MRYYGKAELAVVLDGVVLGSNLMGAVDVNAACAVGHRDAGKAYTDQVAVQRRLFNAPHGDSATPVGADERVAHHQESPRRVRGNAAKAVRRGGRPVLVGSDEEALDAHGCDAARLDSVFGQAPDGQPAHDHAAQANLVA